MYADIEALVLSGELFNGGPRSSSPARSQSPEEDHGWHDDELEMSTEEQKLRDQALDYDIDTDRRNAAKQKGSETESIGMGPGRTGVKGVIRDREEAEGMEREKRARELDELRTRMEASNLGGKTFLEEERERAARGEENIDELVLKEREKEMAERRDVFGRKREGKFGHLREVGLKGFLSAVEKEDPGVWVVVHLYDPSLERCYLLDDTLARLARLFPETKFLRARASALGFATSNSSSKKLSSMNNVSRRSKSLTDDDDDDPYAYDDKDNEEYRDEEPHEVDDDVDLDMLPTMLVYRNGELVHNWVRVDWEAGKAGIEELLDRHHLLPRQSSLGRKENLGLPSDGSEEDFDLIWSDDDDVKHI